MGGFLVFCVQTYGAVWCLVESSVQRRRSGVEYMSDLLSSSGTRLSLHSVSVMHLAALTARRERKTTQMVYEYYFT